MDPGRWESVEDLQSATDLYQRTWWMDDDRVRHECASRDGLLDELRNISGVVRTVDVYRIGFDTWSPSRELLHATLVRNQIGEGPPRARPRAYFTIGCMGAGKTTVLRSLVAAHRASLGEDPERNLSRVAADEIRESLPEYNGGLGSMVVHHECLDVTYDLMFPAAREAKVDLVFDTIGTIGADDAVSFRPSLDELRDAGFELHLLLATAPLDTCIERAQVRALQMGRLVDRAVAERVYGQPERVLERLVDSGALDGWALVDTSTSGPPWPMKRGTGEWRGLDA